MPERSQILGIVTFAAMGLLFFILQEMSLVLRILGRIDNGLSQLSGTPSIPAGSEAEHHFVHYLIGAGAASAEVLAVIYSVSALTWLAAILLWAAFWDYTKHKRKLWMLHYRIRIPIFLILAVTAYLVTSRGVGAKGEDHPSAPTPAPAETLYSVEIFTNTVVGGSWVGTAPFLWVVDRTDTVRGIDVLVGMQITNLQMIPSEIERFSFELQANGGWVPLNYVPLDDAEAYLGSVLQSSGVPLENAAQVIVSPNDLASALEGHPLNPGIPVRAVGLFQYSSAILSVPTDKQVRYRITIYDVAGHSVSYIETSKITGFQGFRGVNVSLDYVALKVTGKHRNLKQLHLAKSY